MAHRLVVPVFFVLLLLAGALLGQSASQSAAIRISVYAPVQSDSPLHIVGLHYDGQGINFAFSNESDKEVVRAITLATYALPTVCAQAAQLHASMGGGSGGEYHLRLGPHKKSPILKEAPIHAGALIGVAWKSEVANLQVQFAVFEVDFADGTKWKPHEERPQSPFDPSLADADSEPCSDAVIAGRYLKEVEVRLDRSMEKSTYVNDGASSGPPHLSFQCRIEGSTTVCPSS